MLPLILVAVGAYLIGDSVLEGGKKLAKGGKTQGYDDKEDERLAMEHGKMSKKDLDSTHARRDDAQFEERGKMEHGGMASTHKYTISEAKKMLDAEKSKNEGFSWFVPDVDYEGDDNDQEYGVHLSDKALLDLADEIYKKGGEMAKGGKTKSKFFKGQSIIIEKITTPSLIKALPKWNDYAGKELVIEEIEFDKPYKKVTKSFVRETGEKVPFSIFLNDSVEQYKKGGKLVGKQKNLDVNKNGKLDAEDFKMLRGEKMAKGGETSTKNFKTMMNVGKSKYVINYHNGEKTHKDGSPFYDLDIFKNKKDFEARKKKLIADGYKQM